MPVFYSILPRSRGLEAPGWAHGQAEGREQDAGAAAASGVGGPARPETGPRAGGGSADCAFWMTTPPRCAAAGVGRDRPTTDVKTNEILIVSQKKADVRRLCPYQGSLDLYLKPRMILAPFGPVFLACNVPAENSQTSPGS